MDKNDHIHDKVFGVYKDKAQRTLKTELINDHGYSVSINSSFIICPILLLYPYTLFYSSDQ